MPTTAEATVTISEPFESQLGGNAYIIQATPLDASVEQANQLPVFFHGGYGVQNTKYLHYMAAAHGKPAFTVAYDTKRQVDTYYAVNDDEYDVNTRLVHRKELRRLFPAALGSIVAHSQICLGQDILQAAQNYGYDQIDVIGQSAGVLRALTAVHHAPERVRSVVLAYPAGATHPNLRRVGHSGARYVRSWMSRDALVANQQIPSDIAWSTTSAAHATMHEPKNIAADGENVLFSAHSSMLHRLRQSKNAPNVMMVAGEFDTIFSADRLINGLVSGHDIDQFLVLRSLHAIGKRRASLDGIMDLLETSQPIARPLSERIMAEDGVSSQYIDELRAVAKKRSVV